MAQRKNRPLNLRMDPDLVERVEAVALVEGRTITSLIEEALEELIARRHDDPEWQEQKREVLDRYRRLLE